MTLSETFLIGEECMVFAIPVYMSHIFSRIICTLPCCVLFLFLAVKTMIKVAESAASIWMLATFSESTLVLVVSSSRINDLFRSLGHPLQIKMTCTCN